MRLLSGLVVALFVASSAAAVTVGHKDAPQHLTASAPAPARSEPEAAATSTTTAAPTTTSAATRTPTTRARQSRATAAPPSTVLPAKLPIPVVAVPVPGVVNVVAPDAGAGCSYVGNAGIPQGQVGVSPLNTSAQQTGFAVTNNCKLYTGDAVDTFVMGMGVNEYVFDWGDASPPTHVHGGGCGGLTITHVQSHTYLIPGHHVITITPKSNCTSAAPPKVLRQGVDVTIGPFPIAAPGAEPCRGLGPSEPQSDAPRYGISRDFVEFPDYSAQIQVSLVNCEVPVGTEVTVTGGGAAVVYVNWNAEPDSVAGTQYRYTPTKPGVYRVDVSGTWGRDDTTAFAVELTLDVTE